MDMISGNKLFFLLQLVILICCFCFESVPKGHAQSRFDSNDDTIHDALEQDNKKQGEPLFDDDDIEFQEPQATLPDTDLTSPSLVSEFLKDVTLSCGHQFSLATDSGGEIIDNSSYIHLEYDTLFLDHLFVTFDGKAWIHPKTDHRADAKKKRMLSETSVREAFIQTGNDHFGLKLGKQVSVWGKADTAIVTDVVSPRDTSQFIFIDLEDARVGQWMMSGSIYFKDVNFYIFLCPLPEVNKEPNANTRYDRPLPGVDLFLIHEDTPEWGDVEYGIKFDWTVSKTDVSLMAGQFYSNTALYHSSGSVENSKPVLEKTFPSYGMMGAALTHTWQRYIFKGELALKKSHPLQGSLPAGQYTLKKKEVIDAAVGLEYNANDLYQIIVEVSNRYIIPGTSGLVPGTDENSSSVYGTFMTDFFNQTLMFEYHFYYHIQEQNRFHQFELTYDLTDSIELSADYTVLHAEDEKSLMWQYQNEDRFGFEVKYYF